MTVPPLLSRAVSIGQALFQASGSPRERLLQQTIFVGSATAVYSLWTPLVVRAVSGLWRWPALGQVGQVTAIMTLYSFFVIYGLIPAGGLLQKQKDLARWLLGKTGTIVLETLASVGLFQGLAHALNWDPMVAFKTSVQVGVTQGIPLSSISGRWANRPVIANLVRQGTMAVMQTNAAVVNAISSEPGHELSNTDMMEVTAFNLALGLVFFLLSGEAARIKGRK